MTEAADIKNEVLNMEKSWNPRKIAFASWYQMISLHNNLKQPDMESVISSDPRTSFNMAQWLLTPKTASTFTIDTVGMDEEVASQIGDVETYANRQFLLANRRSRGTMHGPFIQRLVSLMLATGWLAMASVPTDRGWIFEAFNPAQIYPEYGHDGYLLKLARHYTLNGTEASMRTRNATWVMPSGGFKRNKWHVYSLWKMTPFGPAHGVVIGNHLAKPMTLAPTLIHIPIVCIPAGGLPDDGSITLNEQWRSQVGQSLIAPILDIQNNFNKMLTYLQQLLRDTANPRWVERVRTKGAIDPDTIFKRGAVFSIEPGEDIFPVPTPPLPAEFRGHQFELRGAIQRAQFSDITLGDITGQVNGFLINQVTAQAKQTLGPFFDATKDSLGLSATRNVEIMRDADMDLDGKPFPKLPDETFVSFDYDVKIPGDFIQRVQSARAANPTFKLSHATIYEELFPEVQNAMIETATIRSEDALENPVFKQLILLQELKRSAREAGEMGDEEFANLLNEAAQLVESQFAGNPDEASSVGDATSNQLPPAVQEVLGGLV